jgi:hypothetical protein
MWQYLSWNRICELLLMDGGGRVEIYIPLFLQKKFKDR